MGFLPKKDDGSVDYKNMWEVKLLKGIMLFFGYTVFALYLTLFTYPAWQWAQMKWYVPDFSISALEQTTQTLIDQDQHDLAALLLNSYPVENLDQVVEEMSKMASDFNAPFFFAVSNRYVLKEDTEQAIFWNIYARFRVRYDAVRCDYFLSDVVSDEFSIINANLELTEKFLRLDQDKRQDLVRQVLDFDAAHPPRNDPDYFCKFIQQFKSTDKIAVLPEDDWDIRHDLLRTSAQAFLTSTEDLETDDTNDVNPKIGK